MLVLLIYTGILLLGIGTGSAIPLTGQYSYGVYEVVPLDYDVAPIDDGTEIQEITGWLNLAYWRELLLDHIGRFFDKTPYGEFVGTVILPILGTLLGLCLFIFFNRRNSPETDPASTPAKILRYLEKHPGSRQHQIASGILKSRGAVAYQLHRMKREKKLNAIEVQSGIRYYSKQSDRSSLSTSVLAALENPYQREILRILCQHPHLTRRQIASLLEKSPDTIYRHLNSIDSRILTVQKEMNGYQYSLSPEAKQTYRNLMQY